MESLILAAQEQERSQPAQLSFFENEAYELLESAINGHEFTGERLFARDRRRYELCVKMIAEGLATRQIARALQVSPNTIEAVRRRENGPVDAEKQQLLANVRAAARLTVERVIEMAPTMTGRDAAITAGIMIEKMQLLAGEATTIVGKSDEGIRLADFNALIDSLPSANAREVSDNGLSGATPATKGGEPGAWAAPAAPDPASPASPAPTLALEAPLDQQSLGLQSKSATDNALDHVSTLNSGLQGGGGGVARATPGTRIDLNP